MDIDKIFSGVYEDFFGIDKLTKKNFDDIKKIYDETENIPKIEMPNSNENVEATKITKINRPMEIPLTKEQKDDQMKQFFEAIEKIWITDDSKIALKKIIEYARKYNEGITKIYIPFNIKLYCDNDEVLYDVTDILRDSLNYFKYIEKDESIESTFYLIEEVDKLAEIYNGNNTIIVLKDINALNTREVKLKSKLLNYLETSIEDNKGKAITIVVAKNKEIVDEAFGNNPKLNDKLFNFEIEGKTIKANEVYEILKEKFEENNEKYTEEFEIKLLDYIVATFPKTTLPYPEYIDKLYQKIIFNKNGEKLELANIPEYEKEKSNEEIFAELDELVGLENVKQMLKDLVSLIEFKNKTNGDIKVKDTNLHMVFLGNPGTGKTTVARMIAGILYNLKYIDQNKLIEVSAKDLVAEYVGQTAPKTMSVIEKAMGGVLFIDEAYALASKPGENSSFNEEAIATLIQAMENYRDDIVVIFAGYSKEMQNFLNSNSGIVSRIGYTVEFKDYTVDELIIIFKNMIKKAGFEIEDSAIVRAESIILEYKDTENFGNARFVRNLYEKTVIKHATNTKNKKQKKVLRTITEEDVVADGLLKM